MAEAESTEPAVRPAPRYLAPALVGAILVAIIGAVLAGLTSGVFVPDKISDPGAVVRWALPIIVVLGELALAVTVGALIAVACILPPGRDVQRALVIASVAASVWTIIALVDLVATFANVLGAQGTEQDFGAQLASFIKIPLGLILLTVAIVAALISILALLVRTATGATWVLVLALVPLALAAMTGHTAGAESHNVALSAMFLHLGGAAVWIGTLAVLALIRVRRGLAGPELGSAVARFSEIALWSYVMVGFSGVLSAWIRIGSLPGLTTPYGLVLLSKVFLTVVLGVFGWLHRRNIMMRLARLNVPPATGRAGAQQSGEEAATAESLGSRLFWRLTAVELLIMGAVSGLAASLGSSQPPIPDVVPESRTSSEIIMGEKLPPPESVANWFIQWRWEVIMVFVAGAAIVVYTMWFARLRRRGDAWPVLRLFSWWVGMILFLWVTSGGPAAYGHILFSSHMIQHMILVTVVPIFLVVAAPVTLAMRALPKRRDGSRGPREWLLTLVQSRLGGFFANPVIAAVNFAGSMIMFYYTPVFEFALRTHVGHVVMIVHFTLAGYLFVNALIGIDPGPARPGYPQRILLLFATMAFHAFFGVNLMQSEALLVPEWFGLMGREWGPSAIADQQKGGGIAWGLGEIPTLMLAIIVAFRWSRDDERIARRRDRRVDLVGDVELDEYNQMLARLAKGDAGGPTTQGRGQRVGVVQPEEVAQQEGSAQPKDSAQSGDPAQ